MDEAPVASTESAPAEATAPIETAAPEQTANLLGSADAGGIQPDTSGESWLMGLDEEYRSNPNINKYQSQNEMAKGLINMSSLIGKKGIVRPGEDATPEEMGSYFNSLGRPTESSGYKYEPIEGAPDVDQEQMTGFQEWAHGEGFSQEQFQGTIEYELQRQQAAQAQFEQEKVDEASTTQMELMDEMGEVEYKAFLGDAKSAAESLGLYDVLVEHGLAGNKVVLKAFANARKDLGSSSMIGGDQVNSASFEDQTDAIRNNPGYADRTHPQHQDLIGQLDKLYAKRYPNQK